MKDDAETAAQSRAQSKAPEPGARHIDAGEGRRICSEPRFATLVEAYRMRGFLAAATNPLFPPDAAGSTAEFDPAHHGLSAFSRGTEIATAYLDAAYRGPIGYEFGHIHDPDVRAFWITAAEAHADGRVGRSPARQHALHLLARSCAFESVMAQRLPGAKLFGLGGAESFNVLVERIIAESAGAGVGSVVVGGMHRGRFNMLANVFGKPLTPMLAEIKGSPPVPAGLEVSSDVSYHLGYDGMQNFDGRDVHCTVSAHPSHLQLIPIITQGRARARQTRGDGDSSSVLPLLLHTDASFAGQGLVAEMMQLSRLGPFDLGGTIHIVINNQVGFTTDPSDGRTARHCTDIARMIEAPVLHVNGDDVDAVIRAATLAAEWRAAFRRDIVIDLVCYRRPGHNEIDEPRFTQPKLYAAIDARPPVDEIYAGRLAADGVSSSLEAARSEMVAEIDAGLRDSSGYAVNTADWFQGRWESYRPANVADLTTPVATGVAATELRRIGAALTTLPAGFQPHPKIVRFLDERRASFEGDGAINWAAGEALALASVAAEVKPVRFGGQDSVRGAFTQRHLAVHDAATGAVHNLIRAAAPGNTRIEIHNTPLIEHAILCYEYGITLDDPARLVVWEAQFGEFLNIAQPVFDQAVACGADRWLRASGLVILLPHGLDGGGADHSTGRPERLLAACADANLIVANASTPANYFHLLRRQVTWDVRVPLVVLTPKALLRNKACVSTWAEFEDEAGFRTIIPDPVRNEAIAKRLILTTGKTYHVLDAARRAAGLEHEIALVRIEQLHPFPVDALKTLRAGYWTDDVIWCEEEPANMGYHVHLAGALERAVGRPVPRVGRPAAATPAVGVKSWHQEQEAEYVASALAIG
jgi:2-oxoglutarate dehydrogenase E1 component